MPKCLQHTESCSPNHHTHISAFFLSHRFSRTLTLTDVLHLFISEYQGTAGLCYLETNGFLKIISLLLNFMAMHLYPCSTMRQIWQGLPNSGCNNQTVTSWKRTIGIWKTPEKQLSDSTATFYSSKGMQPGKVSSLWPKCSWRGYLSNSHQSLCGSPRITLPEFGGQHAPVTAPWPGLDEVTLFQSRNNV